MQTEPSVPNAVAADPSVPPPNDESSGLHEIRNLARTTKERLSSRRISGEIPADDVLASSSAGWKAVALPEPAKMVSLPEISELPSAAEVKAKDKAAKKAAKEQAKELAAVAPTASSSVPSLATATAATVTPIETARAKATAKKSNSGRNAAIAALGVAAAAGIVFVALGATGSGSKAGDSAKAPEGAAESRAVQAAPGGMTAQPLPAPPTAATPLAAPAVTPVDAVPAVPTGAAKDTNTDALAQPVLSNNAGSSSNSNVSKSKPVSPKKGLDHPVTIETGKQPSKVEPPTQQQTKVPDKTDKPDGKKQDPSLDDLLKDSNGGEAKKPAAPKLDKKQLTTGDITAGMGSLTAKAQACYKGTQGTATLRVTVAPSGQVTKVAVGGAFAGKPEASCVEGLVRSLSFPAWDGGPQSFGYSYLLSE